MAGDSQAEGESTGEKVVMDLAIFQSEESHIGGFNQKRRDPALFR